MADGSAESKMPDRVRLGVNIDHVATLRNARGEKNPDLLRAAQHAVSAGADKITMHLREDRRHIRDRDIERFHQSQLAPLNMEMAATAEMREIALRVRPEFVLIVPENRQELTTEGGLDVVTAFAALKAFIADLRDEGLRVNLFVDPVAEQIHAAFETGAEAIELHAGPFANQHEAGGAAATRLRPYREAASLADELGLEVHAGHGLNYESAEEILQITQIVELNIGHFLVSEALFLGLRSTIQRMRQILDLAPPRHLSSVGAEK